MAIATRTEVVEALHDIRPGDDVMVRVSDGTLVRGVPSRIERNQAGLRIEICPYRGDDPQYRLRISRTPTGWCAPFVERCPMDGEWERYGRLTGFE